jgi:hypothetical protein
MLNKFDPDNPDIYNHTNEIKIQTENGKNAVLETI